MSLEDFLNKFGYDPTRFIESRFKEGFSYVFLGDNHGLPELAQFVVSLLPFLAQHNLTIYLELESFLQGFIDSYLKTGETKYLDGVIEREKELIKRGFPTEGRISGPYFDIIRKARNFKINVFAIDDNHDKDFKRGDEPVQRRNAYMKDRIKSPGLIYVGEGHIQKSISFSIQNLLSQREDISYPILHEANVRKHSTKTEGFTAEIDPLLMGKPVAFDLRDKEIRKFIKFFTQDYREAMCHLGTAFYQDYDGLVYHSSK